MEWWDNFTNWLSGDDDDFSESAFAGGGEDFEDFYNEVTNNSDYSDNLWVDDSYDANEIFSDYGEEDYLYDEQWGSPADDEEYDQEFWDLYNQLSYADQGGEPDEGYFDWSQGYDEDRQSYGGDGILGALNKFLGNIGQNPNRSGNQLGGIGQYLGDFLSSPLAALLLMNQKNKDAREQINIPIGQEAYGSGAGVGSLPDYRISNIQPALLPGMAYANQPTTFNNTPPGMQSGGVASLENRMEGPGDVTQAMLEPGEFVMTRKATENLTPEYLYSLMHQAENAGRMT